MPSLRLVNPRMSQNITVMTRRSPAVAAGPGRSISPATTCGSMYLPNVSRICWLWRSFSTMRLNAADNCPISSWRDHGDRSIEIAGFDLAGAFQQAPHRAGDAVADQDGEQQSDDGGEPGHDRPTP